MTIVFMYSCYLVFIKFLRLNYCLLVACLDLELSLYEARSRVIKVANEIIRAEARWQINRMEALQYIFHHIYSDFFVKRMLSISIQKLQMKWLELTNIMERAQAKCIFGKNGCFTRPLVHNASNWGSDGFLRVRNLKLLTISYFEVREML